MSEHPLLAFSGYLDAKNRTETVVEGKTYVVVVSSRGEISRVEVESSE